MELVAERLHQRNDCGQDRAPRDSQGRSRGRGHGRRLQACAEFIKLAKQIKLDAVFVNISFVGSNALAEELGEDGKASW